MIRKTLRRHRARRTSILPKNSKMSYNEIKQEALEPQSYYDEWSSCRDGIFNTPARTKKERELKKGIHKRRVKKSQLFRKKWH